MGPDETRDLSHSLVNALGSDGFECSIPEDIDYAFAFRCRVAGRDFYFLVGYVGDGVREWLVSVTSDLGWFRRLFGEDDQQELRRLTTAIHKLLSSSDELRDVRWYTLEEWNEDPAGSWSPAPSK
ncbi:MAG: hypothetical protein KJO98_01475 [Rhodothermia bacterium]|nr:hypothetical protein [Rhodothermia bacterium]